MSDNKKDYVIRLSADDATGPAFESMIARAKEAGAKISRQLGHGKNGDDSFEDKIREQFGRSSTFGGINEMLKGGGALMGITAFAEVTKGIASGIAKMEEDSLDLNKNWADIAQDGMKAIPVFGAIAEAGEAISEDFTHDQRDLQLATDEAKSLDKELAIHKQLIKEGSEYYHDIEETIKRIKAHTAEIGMPGFNKDQIETAASGGDQKKSLDDKAAVEIQNLKDKAQPAIDTLNTQIEQQREKISHGFTMSIPTGPSTAPIITEDVQAKTEATNQLAEFEGRRRMLERDRDNQIGGVKSKTSEADSAIDAETNKGLSHGLTAHERELQEEARQSSIDRNSDFAASNAAQLELQGRFIDAKIAEIHAGADKEDAEARLATDKKEHDLQKGTREWLDIEGEYALKSHDIHQQARDKEAEAVRADQLWKTEEAQKHATEIMDVQAEARDKALRAAGMTFQADHEQLERAHQDRLAKIKENAAAEIAAHGEHKDEIEKRAAESTDAENKSFGMSSLAQQIDAMKQIGPVDMTAHAQSITGGSSNSVGALLEGSVQRNAELGAEGKRIKAMQDQLGVTGGGSKPNPKAASEGHAEKTATLMQELVNLIHQGIKLDIR